jgi:hypothetical protein
LEHRFIKRNTGGENPPGSTKFLTDSDPISVSGEDLFPYPWNFKQGLGMQEGTTRVSVINDAAGKGWTNAIQTGQFFIAGSIDVNQDSVTGSWNPCCGGLRLVCDRQGWQRRSSCGSWSKGRSGDGRWLTHFVAAASRHGRSRRTHGPIRFLSGKAREDRNRQG